MKDSLPARLAVWANAEILTFLLPYCTRTEAPRVQLFACTFKFRGLWSCPLLTQERTTPKTYVDNVQ